MIGVTIQLWDAPPDDVPGNSWAGPRVLTVEFPQGMLILENISSGPVPLEPGGVERVALSGGAGAHHLRAWHPGREQAAVAVAELWKADEAGDEVAGVGRAREVSAAGLAFLIRSSWS